MTIVIGWWGIPLALTVGAWTWACLRPVQHTQGGNFGDIGAAFEVFLRGVLLIVFTLVVWLVYFASFAVLG